jgi:hypothetical protein
MCRRQIEFIAVFYVGLVVLQPGFACRELPPPDPFERYAGINGMAAPPAPATEDTLFQSYPNPFNPTTTIGFNLEATSAVELAIYNALGSRVRILLAGRMPAGECFVVWDTRNETGVPVASGVYFSVLKLDSGRVLRQRMIVLK